MIAAGTPAVLAGIALAAYAAYDIYRVGVAGGLHRLARRRTWRRSPDAADLSQHPAGQTKSVDVAVYQQQPCAGAGNGSDPRLQRQRLLRLLVHASGKLPVLPWSLVKHRRPGQRDDG